MTAHASGIGSGMPPSARGAANQAVAGTTPDPPATDRRAAGRQQPAPPGRPRRTWLGPLVVVVAILALAIVALPGLGPGPGSRRPIRPPQDVAVAVTGCTRRSARATRDGRCTADRHRRTPRPTPTARPAASGQRLSATHRGAAQASRPGLQADGQGDRVARPGGRGQAAGRQRLVRRRTASCGRVARTPRPTRRSPGAASPRRSWRPSSCGRPRPVS